MSKCCLTAALLVLVAGVAPPADAGEEAAITRGREVYIAEGCINCHSQYIRPHVATDIERWGPATPLADLLSERPLLAGNRRQGPDLANVGLRRSAEWNRLHLIAPRSLTPGSVMPTYPHLFAGDDDRGPALLAYLSSLGAERIAERVEFVGQWLPRDLAPKPTPQTDALFQQLCAACHGPAGRGDGALARQLARSPPDWRQGPPWVTAPNDADLLVLARFIKFGLPGTSMPGHEYLADDEIVRLARKVRTLKTER